MTATVINNNQNSQSTSSSFRSKNSTAIKRKKMSSESSSSSSELGGRADGGGRDEQTKASSKTSSSEEEAAESALSVGAGRQSDEATSEQRRVEEDSKEQQQQQQQVGVKREKDDVDQQQRGGETMTPSASNEPKLEDTPQNKQQECMDGQLTNLIVNYLPQSMSQDEIRTLFSSIGEVESCKLIRDKSTINQSLGYGFVNYVRPEDAQRAIKSFNGLRLQNKTIKVSYARPSSESIKGANLYVSGLPKSMTQLELEQLFKPHGKIITSRILCDNLTGISKGVGFVRFDQRFEAERAIEHLNNTYIHIHNNTVEVSREPPSTGELGAGCGADLVDATETSSSSKAASTGQAATPIIVKFANSPSSNPQKQLSAAAAAAAAAAGGGPSPAHLMAAAAAASMHSGGPSAAAAAAYLAAGMRPAQQAAGPVRSGARFHPQPHQALNYHSYPATTNRFRYSPLMAATGQLVDPLLVNPFGGPSQVHLQLQRPLKSATTTTLTNDHLQQQQQQQPPAALLAAGPSALDEHSHRLAAATGQSSAGWCLFVYNLAPEVEESLIWKLFGPFGAVQQVNLVKDSQTNKCKGFAFVTMSDLGQAQLAIQTLNGSSLANRILQVSFKTSKVRKTT